MAETVTLTKNVLEQNVRNRAEMLYLLEHVKRFYLPPENFMTNRYISALLTGKKKLLKIDDVSSFWCPPMTPYFTITDVYNSMLKSFPDIEVYMPLLSKNQNPPRKYFYVGKPYTNNN